LQGNTPCKLGNSWDHCLEHSLYQQVNKSLDCLPLGGNLPHTTHTQPSGDYFASLQLQV
jgi:hypothetical protein